MDLGGPLLVSIWFIRLKMIIIRKDRLNNGKVDFSDFCQQNHKTSQNANDIKNLFPADIFCKPSCLAS